MSSIRTCTRCGAEGLTGECPTCAAAWEVRQDVDTMTPQERADELQGWFNSALEIEFPKMHKRIEELVGRPVWTHELGSSGSVYLIHETLAGEHPGTEGVLGKLPHDKPVIVVERDDW